MAKRLVIAGVSSGVGKTTVTLSLLAAFKARGLRVQSYKCGPDYIDPTFHRAVTGREAHNLDSWMGNDELVCDIVSRYEAETDISIIEGVMGMFDGLDARSDKASTVDIARITNSKVLLVVDCSKAARSVAATVLGFQQLAGEGRIIGIIANLVGSSGHAKLVRDAVESVCHIPVIGYLTRDAAIELEERHLGLVPAVERGDWDETFIRLADHVSATCDLDKLLAVSECEPLSRCLEEVTAPPTVRIALARDAAFHFYYEENLRLLRAAGAELVEFAPLKGECLPANVHGLYIGGGFPEVYAAELHAQMAVRQSIRRAVAGGLPTLAECGGYMFLAKTLETTDGVTYEMCGAFNGAVKMTKRLVALGYRQVSGDNWLLRTGEEARGHEYHFSTCEVDEPCAFKTKGLFGTGEDGVAVHQLLGGYTHFYFPSHPQLAQRFVDKCRQAVIS